MVIFILVIFEKQAPKCLRSPFATCHAHLYPKFLHLTNFPYNVAYAQQATTRNYAQYGLNSCIFLVVMHATTNLACGVNQTWAKILLWSLCYLQHGRFYFGVLALVSFVSSNFVCNIANCQMEGPTYCFGPITLLDAWCLYMLNSIFLCEFLPWN